MPNKEKNNIGDKYWSIETSSITKDTIAITNKIVIITIATVVFRFVLFPIRVRFVNTSIRSKKFTV